MNVTNINAHARVSVTAETTASKVLPIIESEPIEVRVFYVDDTKCLNNGTKKFETCTDGSDGNYENELISTSLLEHTGSNEEDGTITWTNKAHPVALMIGKHQHIGVRFALAGQSRRPRWSCQRRHLRLHPQIRRML